MARLWKHAPALTSFIIFLTCTSHAKADSAFLQFSAINNPNGSWSYGYTPTSGGPIVLYTDTTPVFGQPGWRGGSCGWVAANTSGADLRLGDSGVWPAGYLSLLPDNCGSLDVLRWTSPGAGTYQVSGFFQNIDPASTITVHVFANGIPLLSSSALINSSAALTFDFSLFLAAGSVIDFAVDNGGNGSSHDQVGLVANVNPVPEPGTLLLFATGLACTARWRSRKQSTRA